MAKKAYIGVGGVARKIKKGYIGVDGIARRVKKAYIGIGGVARPCWSGGELTYYGSAPSLSSAVYMLAATNNKKYALFGGGQSEGSNVSNTVDAYDKTLAKTVAPTMESVKYEHAAAHTEDYAIFSGGYRGLTHVDAYNSALARTTAPKPDVGRYRLSGTHTPNHALFAGGYDVYNTARADVDAYDNDLARTVATALSAEKYYMGAGSINGVAIFVGGSPSGPATDSGALIPVNFYDASLARTSVIISGCESLIYRAEASAGNFAIFLGTTSILFAFDKDGGYTPLTSIISKRSDATATTVGDFAVFATGHYNGTYYTDSLVVDENLQQSLGPSIGTGRRLASAAPIGDFGLFAGGASNSPSNKVEAYAVM